MLGGGLWYGLLGTVGSATGRMLLPAAAVCFGYCLMWHARGRAQVPFGRRSIQANKSLVRGVPGLLYFGALLSTGILTEMSTPLVWAGIVYSLAAGLPAALYYGIGFGVGRSVPALAAVPAYRRDIDYGALAGFVVFTLRRPLRHVGTLAALVGAALAAAPALALVFHRQMPGVLP